MRHWERSWSVDSFWQQYSARQDQFISTIVMSFKHSIRLQQPFNLFVQQKTNDLHIEIQRIWYRVAVGELSRLGHLLRLDCPSCLLPFWSTQFLRSSSRSSSVASGTSGRPLCSRKDLSWLAISWRRSLAAMISFHTRSNWAKVCTLHHDMFYLHSSHTQADCLFSSLHSSKTLLMTSSLI